MPKKKTFSSPRRVPRVRILMGEMTAMGPGRADLIDAIARTGSISAAGRELSMSYRRAWLLIESTNAAFTEPLVVTATGGAGGGGAIVTDFGRSVVERYRDMERKAAEAIANDFALFSKLLSKPQLVSTLSAKKNGAS
ncbi:LysR family transcriptional regulator [uncultured Oxalicibacterium sp.]|uniref:winged helix-turn-helix domain-containing protein n=1 Tax=uncultured Oxalicibacterium sp. TaxID=1168540 RepID=UPI0025E6CC8B|nr:LysR family transcriptional regulator [uncultured Oxalicibacterium sp.]